VDAGQPVSIHAPSEVTVKPAWLAMNKLPEKPSSTKTSADGFSDHQPIDTSVTVSGSAVLFRIIRLLTSDKSDSSKNAEELRAGFYDPALGPTYARAITRMIEDPEGIEQEVRSQGQRAPLDWVIRLLGIRAVEIVVKEQPALISEADGRELNQIVRSVLRCVNYPGVHNSALTALTKVLKEHWILLPELQSEVLAKLHEAVRGGIGNDVLLRKQIIESFRELPPDHDVWKTLDALSNFDPSKLIREKIKILQRRVKHESTLPMQRSDDTHEAKMPPLNAMDLQQQSHEPGGPEMDAQSWFDEAAAMLTKSPEHQGRLAEIRDTLTQIRAVLRDEDACVYINFWLKAIRYKEGVCIRSFTRIFPERGRADSTTDEKTN